MTVHLVQLDSVWEDPRANFAKVRALLAANPPAPGGLIVLPEMFATGFSFDLSKTCAGAALEAEDFLRAMARKYSVVTLGGVLNPTEDGHGRNEAAAFSPAGECLARYGKQRLFGGENAVHEAGRGPAVFSWAGHAVAPLVCYDLRFPELFRAGTQAGAEIFVVVAAWPAVRIEHWLALLRARAIENQAWVIGANRTGREPRTVYCGRSVVIDPQGRVLADAGENEGVLTATLDPAFVRQWRAEFPAVREFLGA